jgi:hypothetical protein
MAELEPQPLDQLRGLDEGLGKVSPAPAQSAAASA